MSLQFESVMNGFVGDCAALWNGWKTLSPVQREAALARAVTRMTSFMQAPTVTFANVSGWGSFSWSSWTLKIKRSYMAKNDIRYKDFVEVCSTAYHETRHAEQFYRIAQGLCAGALKMPDTSGAQLVQSMAPSGSVRARVAAYQAVISGQNPLDGDAAAKTRVIANFLNVPISVVQHADRMRDYFSNYVSATKPAWFKRATTLDEVNEWMRATYKKTYSELDGWAQGPDGPYKVYRDLPEENDAHGIEDVLQVRVYMRCGNDTPANRKKPRTDAVFGP